MIASHVDGAVAVATLAMLTTMMSGFASRSTSYPSPSLSITSAR